MIKVITEFKDFLALEEDWKKTLEASLSDSVFLTFEWMRAWWKAFGKDKQLLVLLVKDSEGKVSGIAPLMLSKKKIFGVTLRKLSFIYNDNSSCADFLICAEREGTLGAIIEYLKNKSNQWDLLELQNIPLESPNYHILTDLLKKNHLACAVKEGLSSPFIPIKPGWEGYFCARPKRFRKTARNILNRISKFSYATEKFTDYRSDNGILDTVFEISRKSWKARCRRAITSDPDNREFFQELNRITGEKKWRYIWLLSVDGAAVAYEYHLRYKDKVYALRADFNEEYKDYSPGAVLELQIMKEYFSDGLKEYDLCGHNDSYKKNWTDLEREHAVFSVYQESLFGRLLYLFDYQIFYRLRKFLKRYKSLRRLKLFLMRRK